MTERISSGSPWEPKIGFSRAVRVGGRVLVSGTAPVWPDGSCPEDVGVQTRRCFEIVEEALAQAGATRPAATMVVVKALLDERWKVEVEAEATLP